MWGVDFDGDPNIVEVYVGYLRRKLDESPEPSIIRPCAASGIASRADVQTQLSIRARLTLIFVVALALVLAFTGLAIVASCTAPWSRAPPTRSRA